MAQDGGLVDPLSTRPFIQIPGPNPILRMGGPGEWDERQMEGGDILKDNNGQGREMYYLYYHGRALDLEKWPRPGYRIGVAVAPQPLGPFVKAPQNPILDLGRAGSWEDVHVACPCIMRQGPDKYIMWYAGAGSGGPKGWHVGIATASHPLGPWKKYEGNPIIENCGYPGGIVLLNGTYYMYNEHPIGLTAPDYGPFALYTAKDPYGPWEPWEGNPVLAPAGWGVWDDGGYSEAKVVYNSGVFHWFYGGARQENPRNRTMESIGYAFSRDGYHFTPHVDNPVALRDRDPSASAFAEVQCLIEPPLVYLYHTLRYLRGERDDIEELGVQVLATSRPFKLAMPVLQIGELASGATSDLATCPALSLDHIRELAFTVRCTYGASAQAGVRLHVRASADGFAYDTVDYQSFDGPAVPGGAVQATVNASCGPRYIKVAVENLDAGRPVRDLAVTAIVGG